jgi:c(7)-type cytochrome triheme protein
MRRTSSYLALGAVLAAGCLVGKLALAAGDPAPAGDGKDKAAATAPAAPEAAAKAPEAAPKTPDFIKFDRFGKMKMQPVDFPHAKHGKMFPCKDCHEGKEPLFAQKRSETGMKMTEMRAGKGCGSCHDGKKDFGEGADKKKIFAVANCFKCHKAAPKTESKDAQAK